MRRRKNTPNLLIFTLLPVMAAAGWAVRRMLGKRQAQSRAIIPISGSPASDSTRSPGINRVVEMSTIPPEDRARHAKESGVKQPWLDTPGLETKLPSRQRTAAPAPGQESETAPAANAAGHALRAGHALESQPESFTTIFVLLVPFLILVAAIILLVFNHTPVQSQVIVPGGDVNRGQAALQSWGCGSCHTIPGIVGANGKVGPALSGLSDRSYIAGHLENTPANMMLWIMHPQQVSPGTDMPDTGVPASVARDMATFLYSIK